MISFIFIIIIVIIIIIIVVIIIMYVSFRSITRGVRYGFWYNSNGNVIFGLVGIPPAMEVQCNWIG
jgi:hypothetical protein